MTFKHLAINSADIYYDFLDSGNRGRSVVKVSSINRISKNIFIFKLQSKLRSVESAELMINNNTIDYDSYSFISYDNKTGEVRVLIKKSSLSDYFGRTDPLYVYLVTDFKFLVKRVDEWYHNFGDLVQVPTKKTEIDDSFLINEKASEPQAKAIIGVLISPFSYVWGAPGTGKTKMVLAECIKYYIKEKKRILITAPTNNAVEQMLYGIISVLADIDYKKYIIRMGTPSDLFYRKYPDICENKDNAKRLDYISAAILKYKTALSETEKKIIACKKYRQFLNKKEKFIDYKNYVIAMYKECQLRKSELEDVNYRMGNLIEQSEIIHNDILTLENEIEFINSCLEELNKQNLKFSKSWRKKLFKKKFLKITKDIEEKNKALEENNLKLIELVDKQKNYKIELDNLSDENIYLVNQINEIKDKKNALNVSLSFNDELILSDEQFSDKYRLDLFFEKYEKELQAEEITFEKIKEVSYDDLLAHYSESKKVLDGLNENKKNIESENLSERDINSYLIVAATVDSCICRLSPNDSDNAFSHVFLDEAGYCPLIKAVTLTAFNCPVSFLGDHMQLPPVCEANEKDINQYPELELWNKSALYSEIALESDEDKLLSKCLSGNLQYGKMKRFDLLHSYRFSKSLADILAENVYSSDFTGDINSETEIICLNAVYSNPNNERRVNLGECLVIKDYIESHPDENIGILTPYKNQKDAIKKCLSGCNFPSDDIVTVHGAQGREWDTVIFSVTDREDNWYTNSNNPKSNGKCIINTAISRVRKKLIIVCDYNYWKKQNNQLIGNIINCENTKIII